MAMMYCKECGQWRGDIVGIGAYGEGNTMTTRALAEEAERVVPEVTTWRGLAAVLDYRVRRGMLHLDTYKDRVWMAAAVLLGRLG